MFFHYECRTFLVNPYAELLLHSERPANPKLPRSLLLPAVSFVVPLPPSPAGGGLGYTSILAGIERPPSHRLIRHFNVHGLQELAATLFRERADPLLPSRMLPIVTVPRPRAAELLHPDRGPRLQEVLTFAAGDVLRVPTDRRRDVAHFTVVDFGPEISQLQVNVPGNLQAGVHFKSVLQSEGSVLRKHRQHKT